MDARVCLTSSGCRTLKRDDFSYRFVSISATNFTTRKKCTRIMEYNNIIETRPTLEHVSGIKRRKKCYND